MEQIIDGNVSYEDADYNKSYAVQATDNVEVTPIDKELLRQKVFMNQGALIAEKLKTDLFIQANTLKLNELTDKSTLKAMVYYTLLYDVNKDLWMIQPEDTSSITPLSAVMLSYNGNQLVLNNQLLPHERELLLHLNTQISLFNYASSKNLGPNELISNANFYNYLYNRAYIKMEDQLNPPKVP